jgi:hypothetical protein
LLTYMQQLQSQHARMQQSRQLSPVQFGSRSGSSNQARMPLALSR